MIGHVSHRLPSLFHGTLVDTSQLPRKTSQEYISLERQTLKGIFFGYVLRPVREHYEDLQES